MIVHVFDSKHGIATLTPEDAEDLWALRRVISPGDLVKSETSRVFKETGEYSRPDKERIKVTITVAVEQIKLDSTLSRIRIGGRIVDVSNDLLAKGAYHSLSISEGHRLAIRKENSFKQVEENILKGSGRGNEECVIVAMDSRDAGIGIIRGTHLKILPEIESGISGKMYDQSKANKILSSNYFERVAKLLEEDSKEKEARAVFVMGPGTTKNSFANYLQQRGSKGEKSPFSEVKVIDGTDVAGQDGVYMSIRSPKLQESLGETRLAKASKLMNEAMKRISLNDPKIALAFGDNLKAAKAGATESLLVSDKIFSIVQDEDSVVQLLNKVEELGGETFLLDSSTDLGTQVGTLGGVVGLLRFALR